MMTDPEIRISGCLREALEDLQAVSGDVQLHELMDGGPGHASFHSLVDTGVRGLEEYLKGREARVTMRGDAGLNGGARSNGVGMGVELAERALAVIDAALDSVAQTPDYQSSLGVQEGLRHLRGRIQAAVENLAKQDHRRLLELLAESLCRELSLRE